MVTKKKSKEPVVYKNVMIDLETLGTRADAVILSIGAVKFNFTGEVDDDAFYRSISIDSNNEAAPRHISEDTLLWWMDQSAEARKVFNEPKVTLYSALEELTEWFGISQDMQVWSNGADFDIPMMAHAYHTNGLEAPWRFYNARCFRTLKSFGKDVPKPQNKCAHNALQDALTQALWAIEINKKLSA